jgi:hypothetical protein
MDLALEEPASAFEEINARSSCRCWHRSGRARLEYWLPASFEAEIVRPTFGWNQYGRVSLDRCVPALLKTKLGRSYHRLATKWQSKKAPLRERLGGLLKEPSLEIRKALAQVGGDSPFLIPSQAT